MKKLLFTLLILFGAIAQVSADENKTLLLSFITDEVKAAWMPASGWTSIWAFQTGYEGSWYALSDSNSDGIYEASIPDNCDKWLLVCGTGETPNWDKKSIQSGNIDYASEEFYFRINNTLIDTYNIDINNGGVTKLTTPRKSLKFQFANAAANWTKDDAWIGVWAWKDGDKGHWYNPGTPTDGIYTVSIPNVDDYWMLVRGEGSYNEETNWEKKWNESATIAYQNGEQRISEFRKVANNYSPASIFNNLSVVGDFAAGWEPATDGILMSRVCPDITAYFEEGNTLHFYFTIDSRASYHEYRFQNINWDYLPGYDQVNISEDTKVSLTVNAGIQSEVATNGFRIHGHGIYLEKVTIGDPEEVLWTGKHYISYNAADGNAYKEWGNPDSYIAVKRFHSTEAKNYEYKVVANKTWSTYVLPEGPNAKYELKEIGDFKVILSADISAHAHTLGCIAEKYVSVGASGFSTFSSKHSVDFTGQPIKAYRAEINGDNKVVLKQVNKIPNNNGVMLIGETNAEVAVPFTSESDFNEVTNLFKATDGKSDIAGSDTDPYNYVFSTSPAMGFYKLATALDKEKVKVGGAYLHSDTELAAEVGSSRVGWIIDGEETTGINTVEQTQPTVENKVVYNLNGQRVMNPAKGLYIVNGKKVIIK